MTARSRLCAIALLALACTAPKLPTEPEGLAPLVMTYVAGDEQSAYTGFALEVIPAVRVTRAGAPAEGARVKFTPEEGGGSGGGEVRSDADGIARGAPWILGSLPGEQRMSAALLDGQGPPLVFRATAIRPVPVRITAQQSFGGNHGEVGEVSYCCFTAVVTSAEGLGVPGVPVRWTVSHGGVVEVSDQLTGPGGVAGLRRVTYGREIGTHRVTVTALVPDLETATAGWDVRVGSAPPNSATIVSGAMQSALAGSLVPQPIVIEIRDHYGNLVTEDWQTARAITIEGGGSLPYPFAWLEDGRITLTEWRLGPEPGANRILFEVDRLQFEVTATGN